MLRFDKATYLLLIFKFILFQMLGNSLWGLDVFIFLEFINTVPFLHYRFIEFIILLYTFLVISFAWYKEYMICQISSSKFSDVLPAFTCARALDPWSVCSEIHILCYLRSQTWAGWTKILRRSFACVCFSFGDIPLQRY